MPSVFAAKVSPQHPTLVPSAPTNPTLRPTGPSVFNIAEAPTLQGHTGRTGEMAPSVFARGASEPTLQGAPQPLHSVPRQPTLEMEAKPLATSAAGIAQELGLPLGSADVWSELQRRVPTYRGSAPSAFARAPSRTAMPAFPPPAVSDPSMATRPDMPLALRSGRTEQIPALMNTPIGGYMERVGADESEGEHETSILRRALPWAGAAAAAGLAGYGAYKGLRRFQPSSSAKVRQIQQAGRKGFSISDVAKPTEAEQMLGGNTHRISEPGTHVTDAHGVALEPPQLLPPREVPGAVLSYAPHLDRESIKPEVAINFGPAAKALSDKGSFADVMYAQGSGDAIPHTRRLSDIVAEAERQGTSIFQTKANTEPKPLGYERWPQAKRDLRWQAEQVGLDPEAVTKLLGHSDWYIKPTQGARENAANDFASPTSNLWDGPLRRVSEMRTHPDEHIIQAKIPIKNEYRVHTLDDQPFEFLHRRAPSGLIDKAWDSVTKLLGAKAGGSAVPVLSPWKRQQLRQFTAEHMSRLKMEPGEHLHQGIDVAELPDGTFKFIESNPFPATHTGNPFVSEQLQRQVTGRWSPRVARMGAAGVGGATGLAGLIAASKLTGNNDDNSSQDQRA